MLEIKPTPTIVAIVVNKSLSTTDTGAANIKKPKTTSVDIPQKGSANWMNMRFPTM